jgi:hypothetical protein
MIIHYKNNKDTGVRGKTPYLYRKTPSASMNKEAYQKEYTLYTDDWFESGSRFAYSLHATQESAKKFRYFNWWAPSIGIERVYVSKTTLEKITKAQDGRNGGRGAFVSLED